GGFAARIAATATKPPIVATAAPTRNALRYPCNAELSVSARSDALVPWFLTAVLSQLRDAVVATVTRTASPSVPPICWEVLRRADAIPMSAGAMPEVAPSVSGTNVKPRPTARRSCGPRRHTVTAEKITKVVPEWGRATTDE